MSNPEPSDQEATVTKSVVEKYQARALVSIVGLLLVASCLVVWNSHRPDLSLKLIEDMAPSFCAGAIGTSSGCIVFWHLFAHESEWWGKAETALTSILLGAVFGTFLSFLQVLKAVATLLPQ
jgi:hypothetical protein